jgi:drug/metabolite transporter (DMT)-like permease
VGGDDRIRGAASGLVAAALFGASAPLSKLLLPGSDPLALAGLLYMGAGLGLSLHRLAVRRLRPLRHAEARLRPADAPLLAGIVLAGGVAAPVLMLFGLRRLTGVTSALLLNLEGPLTVLLAILLFGEHLDRRESLGTALTMAGAALLTLGPGGFRPDPYGAAAIAAACLLWAFDNNLTQRLSLRDPVAIVHFKTLAAGLASSSLAWATRQSFGSAPRVFAALALGALSYGLSLVLHVRALRLLGAARQAAFFSAAPFLGALLAVPLLGERPRWTDAAGAGVMLAGLVVLARARHAHRHTHVPLEHDHLHVHDEHHRHVHQGPVEEPHSHPHRHEALTHEHPHVSDLHHRHPHG